MTPALSGEYVTEAILARLAAIRPPRPIIYVDKPPPARRVGRRKPSIATLIKRAEKAGKPVTSITTPDGTRFEFGQPESAELANPWFEDLRKETKQ